MLAAGAAAILAAASAGAHADNAAAIARIKASIVAVGTVQPLRAPAFQLRGTGFAVADGSIIVTNAHVLPAQLAVEAKESLAVLVPGTAPQLRAARQLRSDAEHDLALLKAEGAPLPPLALRDSDTVKEGETFLFTGFPIGVVLGAYPATHRGMIASITPIAIPTMGARQLDAKMVRRLAAGAFPIFQLDGTAYPGNSGSPLYDPATQEVVGVINMGLVKGTKESALTNPSGISYAIPGKYLQALLREVK
jgi:S1-C subfamily serine protease